MQTDKQESIVSGATAAKGCAVVFAVAALIFGIVVIIGFKQMAGPSSGSIDRKAEEATAEAAAAGFPEITFKRLGSGGTGGSLELVVPQKDLSMDRYLEVCEHVAEHYHSAAAGVLIYEISMQNTTGAVSLYGCPTENPNILRAASQFTPAHLQSISIGKYGISIRGDECQPDDQRCISAVMQDAAALTQELMKAPDYEYKNGDGPTNPGDPRDTLRYSIPHGKVAEPMFTKDGEYNLTPRDWNKPVGDNYVKAPDGSPEILTTAFTLERTGDGGGFIIGEQFPEALRELALINVSMRSNLLFDDSAVGIFFSQNTVNYDMGRDTVTGDEGQRSQCGMFVDVHKQVQTFAKEYGFQTESPEAPYYCPDTVNKPEFT